MCDFYLYAGKNETLETEYEGLQKCSIVVARLCKHLPEHKSHKLFFDNWFTTLSLLKHLKLEDIHTAGTIRANRIRNCPMLSNKGFEKASWRARWIKEVIQTQVWLLQNGSIIKLRSFVQIMLVSSQSM